MTKQEEQRKKRKKRKSGAFPIYPEPRDYSRALSGLMAKITPLISTRGMGEGGGGFSGNTRTFGAYYNGSGFPDDHGIGIAVS